MHEATLDESNEDLHTARDTLALGDGTAEHSLHFARYTAAFMAEAAKGTIPECDTNRPCAGGATCMSGACIPASGGAAGAAGAGGVDANTGGIGGGGSASTPVAGAGVSGSAIGGASAGAGVPWPMGAAGQATAAVAPGSSTNEPLACACRAPAPTHSSTVGSLGLLLFASLLLAARARRAPR